jgi:death-on-curing protein
MKYLTAEQILFLHHRLIAETGGSYGVRDIGMLQSAVARPQAGFEGKELYPDLCSKAADLMHSLIQNHPFLDRNKRTAVAAAALFLRLNDHEFTAPNQQVESFTLGVARGEKEHSQITRWLRENSQSLS